MNLPDNNESSVKARLESARLKQWHQQGEALLTIENARSFLNAAGLVLFAPRPQIAAPAPSFVEAVLGAPTPVPTSNQSAPARELLARLVGEGLAAPLNLLGIGSVIGQAGDAPDFVASAQAFSYVFTLRGDKTWKQPPQSVGAVKFSNLAIATHETLTRRGPMPAYDLAGELGKEVTESAVLRALGELWTHLRVLPLPQLNGRPTVWELATARFTRQIKAGANAGQPTALSALVSLYLGQAIVASEDEVESFLSPLSARSRVRDVLHALVSARQLETVAIEGKTVLHVAGEQLAFMDEEVHETARESAAEPDADSKAAAVAEELEHAQATAAQDDMVDSQRGEAPEPASRIAKFVPRRKPGAGDLAKARPAKSAWKPFQAKPSPGGRPFAPRGDRTGLRSDRTASRSDRTASGGDRTASRSDRTASGGDRTGSRGDRSRPPFRDAKSGRPFRERSGFKPAEEFAAERKPRFEKRRFSGTDSQSKPRFDRRAPEEAKSRSERRPFVPREDRENRPPRKFADPNAMGRPPRKSFGQGDDRRTDKPFAKPGSFGSKPSSFGSKPGRFGFGRESSSGSERPKRDFNSKPFGRPKPAGRNQKDGARSGPGAPGGRRPFAKPGWAGKPSGRRDREEGGRPDRARAAGFGGRRPGAKFAGGKFDRNKLGRKKSSSGKPSAKRKPGPSPSQGESEA